MAVESIKNSARDGMIARYASTNRLLTSYMYKGESHFKFTRKRAASDLWVEMIGDMMTLDSA